MSNFYCAAPWRGLHIDPRSNIKTCCAGNSNMLGNLNNNTIDQVLNGQKLQEIRKAISQGQDHPYCSICKYSENQGNQSERMWHNQENPDIDYATAGTEYHYPTIIDVRWNTTCNLSCNYCDSNSSSRWADLIGEPYQLKTRTHYTDVCNFIGQHSHNTKTLALIGGEPLLMVENERLLDVIDLDCQITVITNLNHNLEKNKVFCKLRERKKVSWSLSFDNIQERFEYVRYGASWPLMQNNLLIINELKRSQGHTGGAHAVYNLYNATRLCEFKEFLNSIDLSVLWQPLFSMPHLDPHQHNQRVKELAIKEIELAFSKNLFADNEQEYMQQHASRLQNSMQQNLNITNKFQEYTTKIETKYHPNSKDKFVKLWPELAFLMETV